MLSLPLICYVCMPLILIINYYVGIFSVDGISFSVLTINKHCYAFDGQFPPFSLKRGLLGFSEATNKLNFICL